MATPELPEGESTPAKGSSPITEVPLYQRDDIERGLLEQIVVWFQRWEVRLGQGMVSMLMMLAIFAAMMVYAFAVKPI